MGQKLVLAGVSFSNTGLPIIYDDTRLNPGSLALFDMTHSLSTPATGVPANNSAIYNVAWNQAAAMLGSGSASTLAFTFTNGYTSTSQAVFERTTKGALNGVCSATNQGGYDAEIRLAAAIEAYLSANPAHEYALFRWINQSRVASGSYSVNRDVQICNFAGANSNYLFNAGVSATTGLLQSALDAPTGWTGTPGTDGCYITSWGNAGAFKGTNSNNGQSFILYSAHLVDVTRSGMTYAQLLAADQALFATQFASGGKYYGDTTATTPSMVP